jgi:hypothetical protein
MRRRLRLLPLLWLLPISRAAAARVPAAERERYVEHAVAIARARRAEPGGKRAYRTNAARACRPTSGSRTSDRST